MRTRQSVAVPASSQSTSGPSAKKPSASAPSYLAEVRAMQRAQRTDKIPPARELDGGYLQPGGIYAPAYTLEGRLTHAKECTACFGRHDWRCRRCLELLRGAAPRSANFGPSPDSRQRRLF